MPYDNRGKVSLWKRPQKGPKSPIMTGTVVAHRDIREGEELDIALWKNDSDNPKAPQATGKIQDKFEQRADARAKDHYERDAPSQRNVYEDAPYDDSIPFMRLTEPF